VITFSYDDATTGGTLHCEFCDREIAVREADEWRLGDGSLGFPAPELVIRDHFCFNANGRVTRCKGIAKWRDTTWEAMDSNSKAILARGRVIVSSQNTEIVTDWQV
jgi:hypothetical protein